MVYEIAFSDSQWKLLSTHLLSSPGDRSSRAEQLVFVLAGSVHSDRGVRLTAREIILARPSDFDHQSASRLRPTGQFVAAALSRCRQEGWSLIEIHSHPFDDGLNTTFSSIDWRNDRAKMTVVADLLQPQAYHVTMVVGQASSDAHFYDRSSGQIYPVGCIKILGADENGWGVWTLPTSTAMPASTFEIEERHERQVPLVGANTQEIMAKSAAMIIGLGGLGSFVALELAHLGVGRLALVDPDRVELSNLNRLLSASSSDVGRLKVDVVSDAIQRVDSTIILETYPTSILDVSALDAAKKSDVLLGCVDNHGARLILNRLSTQYLIPLVDAGVGARIRVGADPSWDVGGQVQVVLPGLGCLECRGFIDAARAGFDLASFETQEYEREHGYGTGQSAPSIIHLNGVVASLQVSMALTALDPANVLRWSSPIVLYDATKPSLTAALVSGNPNCPTCGAEGIGGLAESYPVFEREKFSSPPVEYGQFGAE